MPELNVTGPQIKAPDDSGWKLWKNPLVFHNNVPPERQDFLTNAYNDAVRLADAALSALQRQDLTIFDHYFARDDEIFVTRVFSAFVRGAIDNYAQPAHSPIQDVTVHNGGMPGRWNLCERSNVPIYLQPIARRGTDWAGAGSSIHGCESFFAAPPNWIMKIDCRQIWAAWPKMTWSMVTPGGRFLHEWMHYDDLVRADNGLPIRDQTTAIANKNYPAYGPYWTRRYKDAPRTAPRDNADNFHWFAVESFYNQRCYGKRFEYPDYDAQMAMFATDIGSQQNPWDVAPPNQQRKG